jgi:adenosylhomocysteinase
VDAADAGRERIGWIRSRMPLLAAARKDFSRTRPFEGRRIGMSLHLEPKTAVLLETLAAGGAEVVATGNHGSTQDDVVAALRDTGMTVFGARDDDWDRHLANVAAVVDASPDILLDNGADLAAGVVGGGLASGVIGGTEETTSGGDRLRSELSGLVPFPVIVINDSRLKAIGENRHAVGQSVVESLMRITNLMVPGKHFVVVGYGWCGRGIAQYLRALGGQVSVVEVDVFKAFEAALDGYRVASLAQLAPWADVLITATGRPGIVTEEHFALLRDGAVLANSGHFPTEIDVPALRSVATSVEPLAEAIEGVRLPNGRTVILLAGGRMVNLAGRDPKGNSIESMDLGFLLQALSLEQIARGSSALIPGPQGVPEPVEREIARRFLASLDAER